MEDCVGTVTEQLKSNFEAGRVGFLDIKKGVENNPTINVFGLCYISDSTTKRVMVVSKKNDEYIGYQLPMDYADLWQKFKYSKYMSTVHGVAFLPYEMIFYISPETSEYKYMYTSVKEGSAHEG